MSEPRQSWVEIIKRRQKNGWLASWEEVDILIEQISALESELTKARIEVDRYKDLEAMAVGELTKAQNALRIMGVTLAEDGTITTDMPKWHKAMHVVADSQATAENKALREENAVQRQTIQMLQIGRPLDGMDRQRVRELEAENAALKADIKSMLAESADKDRQISIADAELQDARDIIANIKDWLRKVSE